MLTSRSLQYQHAHPPGSTQAFADVDVPQGGVLLLSGGAGSGKSTWLALAAGLLGASSGELQVAGASLGAMTPAARHTWRLRAVGVLPQTAPVLPLLTVRANLALAFAAAEVTEDRWAIAHALSAVNLESLAKRQAASLSPAQARHLALARAMLLEPRLLLLDEPVAGLDDAQAHSLLTALQAWVAEKGATLILAARDVALPSALFAQAQHLALAATGNAAP